MSFDYPRRWRLTAEPEGHLEADLRRRSALESVKAQIASMQMWSRAGLAHRWGPLCAVSFKYCLVCFVVWLKVSAVFLIFFLLSIFVCFCFFIVLGNYVRDINMVWCLFYFFFLNYRLILYFMFFCILFFSCIVILNHTSNKNDVIYYYYHFEK